MLPLLQKREWEAICSSTKQRTAADLKSHRRMFAQHQVEDDQLCPCHRIEKCEKSVKDVGRRYPYPATEPCDDLLLPIASAKTLEETRRRI